MAKQTFKKALSFIMAFCMIISLFTCISLVPASAATSDYMFYINGSGGDSKQVMFRHNSHSGEHPDWEFVSNTTYTFSCRLKLESSILPSDFYWKLLRIYYYNTSDAKTGIDKSTVTQSYDAETLSYSVTFTVPSDCRNYSNTEIRIGDPGWNGYVYKIWIADISLKAEGSSIEMMPEIKESNTKVANSVSADNIYTLYNSKTYVQVQAKGDTFPEIQAPVIPDLVIVKNDANANNRLDYTKAWGTVKAGNYRFEMDCKIFGGTPYISVGENGTGAILDCQSNYVATYDKANNKYIITFTMDSDWEGSLGVRIGNYYQTDVSDFACANPTLYLLDANGNPTGSSLINTFASKYYNYTANAVRDTWRIPAKDKMTCTTVPDGYFDPAPVTTGTPYMAIFNQGYSWNVVEYNDAYLGLGKNQTYVLTIDERDVTGNPTVYITDSSNTSIKANYTSAYTDEKVGNIRTITFTMSKTVEDVRIRIGNYSDDKNISAKFANVKLVEQGADVNLIAGFSSDTMASTAVNRKWRKANQTTSGNISTFYTTAIPEGYLEGNLTDKMFYISKITTSTKYGNTILNTGAMLTAGKTYTVELDWKANAGLDPALRATYKNTAGSWTSLSFADFVGESGHYTLTFTMPDDTTAEGIFNFQLGVGADIKDDDVFNYGRGSVYYGNFSLKEQGSDVNLLTNSDLKLAKQGDFTGSVAWNIGVDKNNGSRDLYGDLLVLDQPAGFFTDSVALEDQKVVKFNGGSYDYIRQDLVLKSGTTYRLTYKYAFVNAPSTQFLQFIDVDSEFTTASYSKNEYNSETRTKTLEFTTLENMRDRKSNAVLSFLIESNGLDVKFNFADVKLYEVVDGNTVGSNIINNGGFYFGDEIKLDSALKNDVKDARSTGTLQLLGWEIYGTFAANESIEVVKYNEDDFAAVVPAFAERLTNIRLILLGKVDATYDEYEDLNKDGKVDLKDLVRTKKNAGEAKIPNGSDDVAYAWKAEYLNGSNATDTSNITGTIYYVDAVSGNDNNDGKSPEKAWKSISKVNNKSYSSGDAVLFKAGQTWRPTSVSKDDVLTTKSGVTYGAYGAGAKPQIVGSVYNYATRTWTKVSDNVWKTEVSRNYSAGIVVYNGGELIGSMTKTKDDVANGNIGDFCHYKVVDNNISSTDAYIYVNCPENPANYWDDIEIGTYRTVVGLASNVTMDNIAVMYTGYHGMDSGSGVSNITIQNCVVSYIGGSYNDTNRLGNGIQFGISGSNLTVKDTYVSECYDAGITFQTWQSISGNGYWRNLTFTNNLVENCNYAFEWFGLDATAMENIKIDGNIFRGSGYGWSYDERLGYGDDLGVQQTSAFRVGQDGWYTSVSNFQITNNIFDRSKKGLVYWWWNSKDTAEADRVYYNADQFVISGNSFYQEKNGENIIMIYADEGHVQGISSYGVLEALKLFENTANPTGNAEAVITDATIFVD